MRKPIPYKEPVKQEYFFQNHKIKKILIVAGFALINVILAVIATLILSIAFNLSTLIVAIVIGSILCFTSAIIGKKFFA